MRQQHWLWQQASGGGGEGSFFLVQIERHERKKFSDINISYEISASDKRFFRRRPPPPPGPLPLLSFLSKSSWQLPSISPPPPPLPPLLSLRLFFFSPLPISTSHSDPNWPNGFLKTNSKFTSKFVLAILILLRIYFWRPFVTHIYIYIYVQIKCCPKIWSGQYSTPNARTDRADCF